MRASPFSLFATHRTRNPSFKRRSQEVAVGLWACILLLLLFFPLPINGQVNSYGEFTKTIPISVPAFYGLEPQLGLSYFSNPANGWIGAGWSLNGGPSYIVRASKGRGAPRFDASDIFLMDGMELVPCSPQSISPSCTSAVAAFGNSNGFYSTKIENFERIQYFTFVNAGTTSDAWLVWTKTGARRVFNQEIGSYPFTNRWALSTETDTHGNSVGYSYAADPGYIHPNESYLYLIGYGDTAGAEGARVWFYSVARPDTVTYGVGPFLAKKQKLLESIDVLFGGNRVRVYQLHYHASGSTGDSLLDSVQVFGKDSVVNCGRGPGDPCDNSKPQGLVVSGTAWPKTTFQYDETANSQLYQVNAPFSIPDGDPLIAGDFDGDGRTDYLHVDNYFNTYLSKSDGSFTANSNTPIPDWCKAGSATNALACFVSTTRDSNGNIISQLVYPVVIGDFNGDGKTDFMVAADNLVVFLSNGDGTFNALSPQPLQNCSGPAYQCLSAPIPDNTGRSVPPRDGRPRPRVLSPGEIITGDFNGDGKTDFMVVSDNFYIYLSNGDGTFQAVKMAPPFNNSSLGQIWCDPKYSTGKALDCLNTDLNHIIIGDFDGDGKTDFLSANKTSGNFDVFRSNGDGTFTWIPVPPSATTSCAAAACLSSSPNAVIVGDFNGDGKTDFASAGTNNVFLSNGDGSFTMVSGATLPPLCAGNVNAPGQGCLNPALNHVVIGDFNGDGKADFMSANNSFEVWVSLGDGNFREANVTQPPPGCATASQCVSSSANVVLVGDFNGDGKTDFLLNALGLWLPAGGPPDHLIQISNGVGGSTSVSYLPSSKYSNSFLPVGAVYETVSAITVADGRGVSDRHSYNYVGGLWDNGEVRFLGFRSVTEVLDAAGDSLQTVYRQSAACPSRPEQIYLKDPRGNIYSLRHFSFTPQGNAPYQCLVSSRSDYEAELTCNDTDVSCAETARVISTDYQYDPYGNLSLRIEHGDAKAAGDKRTTQTSYGYNLKDYIVALPLVETVYAGEKAGGSLPIKSSVFTYDNQEDLTSPPTRGDLTQRIDSPSTDRHFDVPTYYDYDVFGNVIGIRNSKHIIESIVYDTYNLYPTKSCNALPQCTTFTFDDGFGELTSVTDINNQTTKYSYDLFGRRLAVFYPDGGQVQDSYQFSAVGEKVREAISDGSTDGLWSDRFTDGLGRVIAVVRKGACEIDTQYSDATTQPSQQSNCYGSGSSPMWFKFSYDGIKRLTTETLPDGTNLRTVYGIGSVTRYDALGRDKAFYRDAYGRTVSIVEHVANRFPKTTYIYDPSGRLIQAQDAAGNYSLTTWDMLGRKLSSSDPDMGTWTYTYDPIEINQVLTETDAKGQTVTFGYDPLNRLINKTYPDKSKVVWKFDEAGHGAGTGRLTSVVELTAQGITKGTEGFSYDSMGRIVTFTKCRDSVCATTEYVYDTAGRLTQLVYPDASGVTSSASETVSYKYDWSGRLLSLVGSVPYGSSISYEPDGQVSTVTYGNGTSAQFSYDDDRRWLSSTNVFGPGHNHATLYSASYKHDAAGRIYAVSSSTNPLLNLTLVYDDLDRLTQVNGGQNQQFTYDDIGNMKSNSLVGAYTYPPPQNCSPPNPCITQPHAVQTAGSNSYQYDASGNMISGAGRTISWNYDNFPISVTTSVGSTLFDYDWSNKRVSKQEPGDSAPTYYFNRFVERSPSGGLVYSYYAGPTLVARRSGGTVTWYHQDHLGSERLITDAQGNATQKYDYAAFGATTAPVGDAPDPFGFIGQLRNPSTSVPGGDISGLIYMNARYYDATLGRFISADSMIPYPLNPQSLNRYSYVENSPVMLTDSSGHLPVYGCVSGRMTCRGGWPFRDPSHGLRLSASGMNGMAMAAFEELQGLTTTVVDASVSQPPLDVVEMAADDVWESGMAMVAFEEPATGEPGSAENPEELPVVVVHTPEPAGPGSAENPEEWPGVEMPVIVVHTPGNPASQVAPLGNSSSETAAKVNGGVVKVTGGAAAFFTAARAAQTPMTIGGLIGPAGEMPAGLALTEGGAWAGPWAGVAGAFTVGYLIGTGIEAGFEAAFGRMPADYIYEWLNP